MATPRLDLISDLSEFMAAYKAVTEGMFDKRIAELKKVEKEAHATLDQVTEGMNFDKLKKSADAYAAEKKAFADKVCEEAEAVKAQLSAALEEAKVGAKEAKAAQAEAKAVKKSLEDAAAVAAAAVASQQAELAKSQAAVVAQAEALTKSRQEVEALRQELSDKLATIRAISA